MKHYQVQVLSSIGGYITINATSEESAVQQIQKEVDYHGVEPLIDKLYNNTSEKYRDYTGAEINHRDEEVTIDSTISNQAFDRQLIIGNKKYDSITGEWSKINK